MANPTPQQVRIRQRFEVVIGLFAPALDLLLAAGDRLSRTVGADNEYYPIRPPGEAFELKAPPAQEELESSESPGGSGS